MTEADVLAIIEKDQKRMAVLQAVSKVNPPDWWVGAGFVRNAVWDALHGYTESTPLNDVDVVYFRALGEYEIPEEELSEAIKADMPNPVWDEEKRFEADLIAALPEIGFEVKNQARMHLWSKKDHNRARYSKATDGIADWTETATVCGIRMRGDGSLELFAPYLSDLVHGVIRPTRLEVEERARERAATKGWFEKWPNLHFEAPL